jgi:hypothetical protein
VTFGFVARGGGSAGLRRARFQAVSGESSPAGIGWNLWGMLPHLLPQDTTKGHDHGRSHAPLDGPNASRS